MKFTEQAEYISLGFSALGTIAAAVTQQTLYAATPLTIALSLNLLNRQELARRTRQIGNNITQLEQQASSNIHSLENQLQSVENSLDALPSSLEATGINKLEEFRQIDAHINQISEQLQALEEFKAQLNKFVTTETVTEIQAQFREQLNVLKLRLDDLPASPEPVDLAEIEQAIAKIGELGQELEKLKQKFQIVSLLASEIGELKRQVKRPNQINEIQQQLENLDVSMTALHDDTHRLEKELENRITEFDYLTQQLLIVPQQLEALKTVTTQLQNKTISLDDRTNNVKSEIKNLETLVVQYVKSEDLEKDLARLSEQFTGQIDVNIEKQIQTFNQLIQETRPDYKYELVLNRNGSRKVLIDALQTAKKRLIFVCPWMTYRSVDYKIIELCKNFLDKRGILEIGWGHLSDTSLDKHEPMTEDDFLARVSQKKNADFWYKNKLDEFKKIQQEYPNQLNLKLLGTHEKFLVCDRAFAMVGSHNFLTSGNSSSERELGLRTTDPSIIKQLIAHFEQAKDLASWRSPSNVKQQQHHNNNNSKYEWNRKF